MPARDLFIAAYDISDPRRLQKVSSILKEYSTGGQKSVFECFMTDAERQQMTARVLDVIDPEKDRFLVLRLDPRGDIRVFGKGVRPENPVFFLVG